MQCRISSTIMRNVIMLSVGILNVIIAERCYAECRYAGCRGAVLTIGGCAIKLFMPRPINSLRLFSIAGHFHPSLTYSIKAKALTLE